ncbi:MAG: hypothetical protein V2A66_03715 [Pseudomonadota bacterium]
MKIVISLVIFVVAALLIQLSFSGCRLGLAELWAVKAPSSESRQGAEKGKKKGANLSCNMGDIRKSGCKYGRDKATKKCYEPREGQFYCDPATGKVERKKTTCYNLPWKPCK